MRYLKTASPLYKCHDMAACIMAALVGMPVFGALLYATVELVLSGHFPATIHSPRGIASMILMGLAGIAYGAKLFSNGHDHNPDETPFYRRNEDEQEYISSILLPVSIFWFFAYFLSFALLYIPFAPFYMARVLRK